MSHTDAHAPTSGPLDVHPDGRPMTQDEIDTHWLTHVYKPNEKQLTLRAVVTGMFLGGVMSISNLYVGLRAGWGLAVTVTAALLAFGTFTALRKAGVFKDDFTSLENNTMASAASAAGYFAGAGLTSAIPALTLATGIVIPWWQLLLWILAISFLGVLLAVPMRRQLIDIDRLPFPEGLAYAETIRSLHAAPGEARKKALALIGAAGVAGLVKLANSLVGLKNGWQMKGALLPEHLPFLPLAKLKFLAGMSLSLATDLTFIGAGALMGLRIGFGLLVGAVVAYGVLGGEWLPTHGLAGPAATAATVRTWLVWPGVAIIVVNGLLAFALKWKTALKALKSLSALARGGDMGGMASVEVPGTWFVRGLLACTALTVVLAKVFFGIPIWMGLLATVLSILLSIVACRATGETSITPIGALGKITQFMYGGLAAGNIQTNLMTASVTAGAAMHSADLLTDLKGGYVLGSRPRYQFIAQFFGILAGGAFCIPAYYLLTAERTVVQPDGSTVVEQPLGSDQFPAPAAMTWKAVAELLARGVDRTVRGEVDATGMGWSPVTIEKLPAGAATGDVLRVTNGPNAGEYRVEAIAGATVALSPKLKEPLAEATAVTIDGRGDAKMKGAKALGFARLSQVPANTGKGDWLKTDVAGHDLWWNIQRVEGDVLVLDRAAIDPREGAAPLAPTFKAEVRKESLPPYAALAVLIATIVAAVLTVIEVFAPPKVKKWIPSTTGLGLGFVVSGYDSISMFLGAVIAWAFTKAKPKAADDYLLATASGIMAGGSLIGVLLIALAFILEWIVIA